MLEIPKRPFGRSGIPVSILGFGGWHIGVPKTDAEGVRLLHSALDAGARADIRDSGYQLTPLEWADWYVGDASRGREPKEYAAIAAHLRLILNSGVS